MKSILLMIATILAAAPALAQTVGFYNGNNISITTYSGVAYLNCFNEHPINETYYCDGDDVEPGASDVLVVNSSMDADHVSLVATHPNGKQASKRNVGFDAKKGQSALIDLLTTSVFQRPLLDIGQNKIDYSFIKSGKIVAQGSFIAGVQLLGQLRCPALTLMGSGVECMQHNEVPVCDDYFRHVQNCR